MGFYKIAQNTLDIVLFFLNELFRTTAAQYRQPVGAEVCHFFFGELISVLDFDNFQILSGCIAPSCIPLATILGITLQLLHQITMIF